MQNYPWYREWQKDLSDKGVVVLGIHTPETSAERIVSNLEADLKKKELAFPVAVDNASATWKAWGNNMWPSVYLIDKAGYIRYWWYGELNWQNAGAQKQFRQYLEQLLEE